jgi:Domain of unknown function DUF29
MGNTTLYDRDFFAWANEQAALLRAGRLSAADIEHIAEEIESMGRSEKRELVSRLTVLLLHLLKWQFQPALRGKSWRNSIEIQRIALASHLQDNPSLKSSVDEAIRDAFRVARLEAESETGIDRSGFPSVCPWSFDQLMNDGFWPNG